MTSPSIPQRLGNRQRTAINSRLDNGMYVSNTIWRAESSDQFHGHHQRGSDSCILRHGEDDDDDDNTPPHRPTERSPLLDQGDPSTDTCDRNKANMDDDGQKTIAQLEGTWQQETKMIVTYAVPLMVTYLLQYSITATSIFAVGKLGPKELGAASLAGISASITCLTPFQGLASSLDTLCAQAYGSGNKHLVGIQCQRMALFLLCLSGPVAVLWINTEQILLHIVPDADTATLVGQYLKIHAFAIPGIALVEPAKRFLQAQGLFQACTYVILIIVPTNIFLHWFLVWKMNLGYVGAPIAATITTNLLPVFLVLYVVVVDGSQCWGGVSKRAFTNWMNMIKLAVPGMIMIEAEWLAFEIMTLFASQFGTDYLAAQSVLGTLTSIAYQIPFSLSVAVSTRVGHLIGAGEIHAAKKTVVVAVFAALAVVSFNLALQIALRFRLPLLFTNDDNVVAIVAQSLPLVAIVQFFDGMSAGAHGLLRGVGKQYIGGFVTLISYYGISLPISLALAFGADWKLDGMWTGIAAGLIIVSIVEYAYLSKLNWRKVAEEAAARDETV